jgi:hypothetical protein
MRPQEMGGRLRRQRKNAKVASESIGHASYALAGLHLKKVIDYLR